MFKIFGREIAVYLALVAAVGEVLTGYGLDLDGHGQGVANAIIIFVFAVGTAYSVHEGLLAFASGIVLAAGALFTAFGLEWAPEHQANVLAVITALGGFALRKYVGAPVPAGISPPGSLVKDSAPA
jgi:hypothetical protein